MILYLLENFLSDYNSLNIFNYITVRSACAVLTSLFICLCFGSKFIIFMEQKQKKGQPIRQDGPPSHLLTKVGTPTMGGILIIFSLISSSLIWSDLSNKFIWIIFYSTVGFGALGFVDDYTKIKKSSSDGINWKIKFLIQILLSLSIVFLILKNFPDGNNYSIYIPFFKSPFVVTSWFFILFSLCVLVGTTNAVNLTDGLDGLAIIPVMITASSMGIISYLVGNYVFSNYLYIQFIPDVGEIVVICAALFGAGLGFLWFNAPPAMIFMGDTGSLSLGGLIASIAISVKHEIVLFIIGGLFVLEASSVIIQVLSYKLIGKRVFMMAPLHHHFEQKGWSESTIVIRFWIISLILAIIGLATLKLR
jgi:phospho-N-acetylmuramoyl-pentapeptide-transferase